MFNLLNIVNSILNFFDLFFSQKVRSSNANAKLFKRFLCTFSSVFTSCLLPLFLSTSVKLCANSEGDVFEKAFCSYRHCIVLFQRLGNVTRFPSHLGSFRNQEDEKSIHEGHRAWLCIARVPPLSLFPKVHFECKEIKWIVYILNWRGKSTFWKSQLTVWQ